MVKILLISNMYPSEEHPSYGIFVKKTMDILSDDPGLSVDKVVMKKTNRKLQKLFSYMLHYLLVFWKLLFLPYDIVYVHYASHNALPVLLVRSLRRNGLLYTNVHGSDVVPENRLQEKLQFLVRKLLAGSNLVLVPSDYFRELVQEKYRLLSPIAVFPSGGIDTELFRPCPDVTPESMGVSSGYRYIGYVGRIDYGKGWDDLIEAFARVTRHPLFRHTKLIIVGNGKEYAALLELIDRHQLTERVILMDMLPHRELVKIFNIIEFLVFPTRRQGESLGLVGLEAMACGTPVIGSNIGGLKSYIIDQKNGALYTPGNVDELVDCMVELKRYSLDAFQSLKLYARETTRRYDSRLLKREFITLFK